MTYAVRVPALHTICFVMGEPFRKDGWTVEPGAWVEVPINVNAWPDGAPRPEQVLCRSVDDEKHYKIFKYRDEVESDEWRETGLNFGGTFSTTSWEQFAETLPSNQSPLPPDNTEVMDEVLRQIQAGR